MDDAQEVFQRVARCDRLPATNEERRALMEPAGASQRPASLADRIAQWADEIAQLLHQLSSGTLTDRNTGSRNGLVFIISPYQWSPLSVADAQIQSRALQEFRRLFDLLFVLFREEPGDHTLLKADAHVIRQFIERENTSSPSPADALRKALESLHRQTAAVAKVFSATEGTLVIPDTNALYWNPTLEDWRSPWGAAFTFVLTPQVISEIDRHKEDSRYPTRQAKAEGLIRRFTEYRRRGNLTDGVRLSGETRIQAIAVEPKVQDSLAWLDASTPDDRLIAAAIEIARQNIRAAIVVVTRDFNLQNKLDFARFPSMSPSDFVQAATERAQKAGPP